MLTRDQFDKETDRRRQAARVAAHWRACAQRVRDQASRASSEADAEALLRIAEDYDYLGQFEERPQRMCV